MQLTFLLICSTIIPTFNIICWNCIIMLFFMSGSNVQVFCPIMLYRNPNWAGCFSTHSRHALSSDIKTMANVTQKRQHVGNVRADIPYMLMFYLIFVMVFISNDKWQRKWVKTHAPQFGLIYSTIGQNILFQNIRLNQSLAIVQVLSC